MQSEALTPAIKDPILLVGPTAVGKTDAALELAERIDAEIINADSMQVYIGMDIGTAKPSAEARRRVRFHLLDLVHPDHPFNVSDWKEKAESALNEIRARGRSAIICGGTGLYIRALLEGWTLAGTPSDPAVRLRLRQEAEQLGSDVLHRRLSEVDPVAAERLHPNDQVRIVRALEVFETTGRPISVYQQQDREVRRDRPAHRVGLTLPRPELGARIEARVDAMIAEGLEEEVKRLLEQGFSPQLSPMRSLGYKEMISQIRGDMDPIAAIAAIKQSTRQFAKRQMTWFRADPLIRWFDASGLSAQSVADHLLQVLEQEQQAGSILPVVTSE